MSLDDRLHRARHEYRALAISAPPLGLEPPAARSGRRAALLAAAAVAVVVLGAGALLLAGGDDGGTLDVGTDTTAPNPDWIPVPHVVGLTVAEATDVLRSAGLSPAVREADSALPSATVIAQEPDTPTEVPASAPGGSVVGLRTALPAVPEWADCPAMAANRAIGPDAFDAMPTVEGAALATVRRTADTWHAGSPGGGASVGGVAREEVLGLYVGDGLVPAAASGEDGEPVATAPGHHLVVEVASADACPATPAFLNGVLTWFTVDWPSSAEPADRPDGEPQDQDPPTSGDDPGADPTGAVAAYDPRLALDPPGPYVDGQTVTLLSPDGYRADWANDHPRLCAVVDDDPAGPGEWCDPLGDLVDAVPTSPTRTDLTLTRRIFTPTGYRDCDEAAVICRLVVQSADGRPRATAPLRFEGDPRPPASTLTVTVGDAPGTLVVDPDGLAPDPSWSELADTDPDRASWYPAVTAELCAFGSSTPDIAPYGEYLWGTYGQRTLLQVNCDALQPLGPFDPADLDAPVTVTTTGLLAGYRGWSDCRTDRCFVRIHRSVVDDVTDEALVGSQAPALAALVPFDPASPVPPRPSRPSLSISDPPPYRPGQTLTVTIAGLPDDRTTNVGGCHVDGPWSCGYFAFGLGNGTHRITLPTRFWGCPPRSCYLELDSQGEGLPPLATAPLDLAD